MRKLKPLLVSVLALTTILGCTPDPYANLASPADFFADHKIGTSPDFGIIKSGNISDHVVTVHGFADDSASCKEIADALNFNACKEIAGGGACLDPYSCVALNQ